MALLDDTARARIEAAIHDVERRTAGEIVVVSVPRSEDYADVRLLYAAACALAAAPLAHLLWPELALLWLPWLQVGVMALGWLLFGVGPVLRRLVPKARLQEAAQRRAREEFLEHNVFATRDRSGVLLLLSELEHSVVLLGDAGIHERVQTSGWEHHVQHVVRAIREGRAADGVCEVISELGVLLAAQFPPRADDRDELSNIVKQEDR
jgi:putative membrane protein